MGQPADARLTSEIARDLCQRTESAAILDGSIASLGSQRTHRRARPPGTRPRYASSDNIAKSRDAYHDFLSLGSNDERMFFRNFRII